MKKWIQQTSKLALPITYSNLYKEGPKGRRYYSTNSPVSPVKFYPNVDTDKLDILSDNKLKSGIYLFINLDNGKRYVGSSVNLRDRFIDYFNINRLIKADSMYICRALIHYGYSKFSLSILEYCEVEQLLNREAYYIDLLKPEYNIVQCPISAPMWGRIHSEETRKQISTSLKDFWKDNSMSEETRNKISAAKKGVKHTQEAKDKISASKMGNVYAENHPARKKIEVFDLETGTKNTYDSMNKAAKAINCSHQTISEYFKRNQIKPYKGRYVFKLV